MDPEAAQDVADARRQVEGLKNMDWAGGSVLSLFRAYRTALTGQAVEHAGRSITGRVRSAGWPGGYANQREWQEAQG